MTLIVALRNFADASKNRLHPVRPQTEQFGLCIRFTVTCLSYGGYNSNQRNTLLKQMPQFKRLVATKNSHINGKTNFSGAKTDEALLLRLREPALTLRRGIDEERKGKKGWKQD
jgi:hypothetical protein